MSFDLSSATPFIENNNPSLNNLRLYSKLLYDSTLEKYITYNKEYKYNKEYTNNWSMNPKWLNTADNYDSQYNFGFKDLLSRNMDFNFHYNNYIPVDFYMDAALESNIVTCNINHVKKESLVRKQQANQIIEDQNKRLKDQVDFLKDEIIYIKMLLASQSCSF
ncbi:hypothetical protein K502DRAFT_365411 [Neoconidiobolus thromboides FSU 785]|nr:hypothetical protein K502DRAFT_365411 [Neoconidiobolus thromboides FSU 785]